MLTREDRIKNLATARLARRSIAGHREIDESGLAALDSTRKAKILERLKDMPVFCRKTYIRAVLGKSQRAAVRAFCMECVCWEREEVRLCSAPACPLYPYRPYK